MAGGQRLSSLRKRPILTVGIPVAGIFALLIACGSDDLPAALPVSTTTAASGAALEEAPAPKTPAGPEALAGKVELGKREFVHDDFRTQVATTIDVAESPVLATAQGRTITVALRNLSSSSGGLSTRATINFGTGFQNFVTLQGTDGEFRLYLSRDGKLGTVPDDSGFR